MTVSDKPASVAFGLALMAVTAAPNTTHATDLDITPIEATFFPTSSDKYKGLVSPAITESQKTINSSGAGMDLKTMIALHKLTATGFPYVTALSDQEYTP